jgi:hypothetical protein
MLLKGDASIRAPRGQVWDILADPNQQGQRVRGWRRMKDDLSMKTSNSIANLYRIGRQW